jgi:hypothetical protein
MVSYPFVLRNALLMLKDAGWLFLVHLTQAQEMASKSISAKLVLGLRSRYLACNQRGLWTHSNMARFSVTYWGKLSGTSLNTTKFFHATRE